MATNVFASLGTRKTGSKGGNYAITGPHWKGKLPKSVKEIKSPTDLVWILGRTYCTGTQGDYEAVYDLQDQYTLTPLTYFGKKYTPTKGTIDRSIDMKTAVRDQVNNLEGKEYFALLTELMKNNPPAPEDKAIVNTMSTLGLVPGQDLEPDKLSPAVINALEHAPKMALKKILAYGNTSGKVKNGWTFQFKLGNYRVNYLLRAYTTYAGLGANLPEDAIYPYTTVDSKGKQLTGTNDYIMHFAKGSLPPVNAFWSLTLYNKDLFFAANPRNRYNINQRDPLISNPDGSIDIYIQYDSPGTEKEANWLPAPKDNFNLIMRLYWPKKTILDGKWAPPAVVRV